MAKPGTTQLQRWKHGATANATPTQRRAAALKWLSVVRQTTIDGETSSAYLLGVEDIEPDVLEQACKDLGTAARGEYEPAMPELGTIRARCAAIERVRRERAESRRLLNAAPSDPISPEKWDEIKAQFQAVLSRKVLR